MTQSRSRWRRTMRRTKMATVERTWWCRVSWIHRSTGTHRRRFTRRALVSSSWRWSGRRTCRALRASHSETRWFCWRSPGRLCFCSTPFSGVCRWSLWVVRCFPSPSTARATTTTLRRRTSRIRWAPRSSRRCVIMTTEMFFSSRRLLKTSERFTTRSVALSR